MFDTSIDPTGARRIPIASLAAAFCAARRRLPASLIHEDPLQSFDLQEETRRYFGFDSHPFYPFATYGTWEHTADLGFSSSELRAEPTRPYYPVQAAKDLEVLQRPDVRSAGMLPTAMRFSELQQERGAPVSVVLGGVFTVAANLCGIERLLRWLIAEPELAHALLAISREHLLDVARHWASRFGAERVTTIVWEEIANAELISARHCEEFVIPQQRKLHEQILELGTRGLICHLCGNQSRHLSLWAEVPMGAQGIVSLGPEVDLEDAHEPLENVKLMGNIDPRLLRLGNPTLVHAATLECLARGREHPGGFILAPGCELQCELPEANLHAMINAAMDGIG
ncbi:MAG: hypothetical protein JRG89_12890 [Deltaproteobacteria bacterium]|nr:hypothetical protein [Deltaproteobacteria bacterium]